MTLPRFAVVDLETSGFSTRWNRILQLGVVVVEADGSEVDRWSTLVRPRWPFSRVGPTDVHGITRSMLRDAPRLDDVLETLRDRIDGAVFTAHNARFDGEFLLRAIRRRRPDDPLRAALSTRLCTLRMSRRLDPERTRPHGLADLCERYDIEFVRRHDALCDAEATAAVLPHLLREHRITDAAQLAPFYDR